MEHHSSDLLPLQNMSCQRREPGIVRIKTGHRIYMAPANGKSILKHELILSISSCGEAGQVGHCVSLPDTIGSALIKSAFS